jgi:acyl-coenzyme A thioesterase PaaI-like protein
MSVADLMPSLAHFVDRPGNQLRDLWDWLQRLPGGNRLFSRMLGQAAPYTATMGARVVELRPGYARVTLADRRAVRNHLRSIHAVALVNLAELTGNVALAYTLPDDARFILEGLSIEYLKKARGLITGECHCPMPHTSERQSFEIPVELRNGAGELVARATLRSLVGPKRPRP